eukprot:15457436-Alexandrium_andersonii.AAC.1
MLWMPFPFEDSPLPSPFALGALAFRSGPPVLGEELRLDVALLAAEAANIVLVWEVAELVARSGDGSDIHRCGHHAGGAGALKVAGGVFLRDGEGVGDGRRGCKADARTEVVPGTPRRRRL